MTLKKKLAGNWRLYLIIDPGLTGKRDCLEIARKAVSAGVRILQLRVRAMPDRELLLLAKRLRSFTRKKNVLFIINDRVDIALACAADGVHLGQDDLPLAAARRLLGNNKIIGLSCRTIAQAKYGQAAGADYLAVGPVFATSVKPERTPVGLELVRRARSKIRIPWLAIGGINRENLKAVMEAGAGRIAVIRAVLTARDIGRACRNLSEAMESFPEKNVPPRYRMRK